MQILLTGCETIRRWSWLQGARSQQLVRLVEIERFRSTVSKVETRRNHVSITTVQTVPQEMLNKKKKMLQLFQPKPG